MDNIFINPPNKNAALWKSGTVISVVSTYSVTIKFDGETEATDKAYKCAKNYTPTVNDHVLIAWFSGSGVVLCNY